MSNHDLKSVIAEIMQASIDNFNKNEMYLLKHDVSERCICAKFACYVDKELCRRNLSQYSVDVEYNRSEKAPKRLHDKNIVVDLIVHKRGSNNGDNNENLICVEMKKTCNRNGCDSDIKRLQNLVDWSYGFNYVAGYMIVADVGYKNEQFGLRIKRSFTENLENEINS